MHAGRNREPPGRRPNGFVRIGRAAPNRSLASNALRARTISPRSPLAPWAASPVVASVDPAVRRGGTALGALHAVGVCRGVLDPSSGGPGNTIIRSSSATSASVPAAVASATCTASHLLSGGHRLPALPLRVPFACWVPVHGLLGSRNSRWRLLRPPSSSVASAPSAAASAGSARLGSLGARVLVGLI